MTSPSELRSQNAGFTLLEVLIAFTILAAGLVLVQQSFSSTAKGNFVANDRAQAYSLATSLIELTAANGADIGEQTGHDANGRAWQITTEQLERSSGPKVTLPLLAIRVDVEAQSWGGQPSTISLSSIRLGTPP